ncbi:MAG: flagellar export chaperone FliS [Pseudomonadales bacterium]|nr:flagellar export chaperone FliS [Pseudomonadales bacterium]MCP5331380.1 flagellar export chaperone FliS [Pseudomonadales bacterium]MCP5344389.1 flagellar export chaperone FliS [Pseudomonadales bacterium]
MYAAQSALAQYKRINTESALEGASPHQLIQMLLNGALERLTQAKGALARQDVAQKGLLIGKAISIVGGLRASLDENAEPQMTANLSSLYEYMQRRLLEANLHNDVARLDEVIDLLTTVKEGWDAIAPAA